MAYCGTPRPPLSVAQVAVEGVEQTYGEPRVLRGLSFALERGQIGCLLARAAAARHVLRCIAGFEAIAAGEIWLNGALVSRRDFRMPTEERRIGMVFQDYALFPHLDIARQHRVRPAPARLGRTRPARCRDAASRGACACGEQYPHELSGGQQQRVALARALAPQPGLLLLDEPFSNLDVELRERLSSEVRDILKQQNATAILVTHDQHEAFNIADVVGLMSRGTIEQWDTPYNLYHEPATRFVADFIGQGTFLPGTVVADNRGPARARVFQTRARADGARCDGRRAAAPRRHPARRLEPAAR